MNHSRRDFIKKAALFSGSAAFATAIPPVIQRALAIHPDVGSTFLDAEHVVFLMQENRSFDHLFGSLQGVRGFNDPRAIQLLNGNRVWLQSDAEGNTYAPFKLHSKTTKVPWMGSTPHGWADQIDARNKGKYDRWVDVKKPYNKEYAHVPLTMGYCDRSDFPFYYALADAFTVCDQNFCSSLTGTHPNRYYWMTGTLREGNTPESKAHVWNNVDFNTPQLDWKTFPERLTQHGIPWKVYQNELTFGYGLGMKERAWLSNFGTNVLEYFKAYNVRLHESAITNLDVREANLLNNMAELENQKDDPEAQQRLAAAKKVLKRTREDKEKYTQQAFEALSPEAKEINRNAFTVNKLDPDYQQLTPLRYNDNGTVRELEVPKGDVLHQFRNDVKNGKLPAVSWLAPPANFSDHPGAPWFGSWYVNEVMEILTENPEIWKKTIFILTYDENDGFFDHIPPYAVPNPYKTGVGKVSNGILAEMDFATATQQSNPSMMDSRIRESAIGLGFRVPMIVASPWTSGGFVNSQLFDHTSSLRFLEHFLHKKFGKQIREDNITTWRRAVCGDLTSVFKTVTSKTKKPAFGDTQKFMAEVHKTQYMDLPRNYKPLTPSEVKQFNADPLQSPFFPKQELGIRDACPIPYELYVNGRYDEITGDYVLNFKAGNQVFGSASAGAPFLVYAINSYENEKLRSWEYAVAAGESLSDTWSVEAFDKHHYHLRVYAPNGFFREFVGSKSNPGIQVSCTYDGDRELSGNICITVQHYGQSVETVTIKDNAYGGVPIQHHLQPGEKKSIVLDTSKQYGWYDFTVQTNVSGWSEHFAGHVETGKLSKTDPLMGGIIV